MDSENRSEVDRLREENASLKARMADAREAHEGATRLRWSLAIVVIAAVLISVSVPAVWLNRVLLDTDAWVDTVAPLASEPAIQRAVSDAASDALIEQIDSRGVAERYLPEELTVLAGPISPSFAWQSGGFLDADAAE